MKYSAIPAGLSVLLVIGCTKPINVSVQEVTSKSNSSIASNDSQSSGASSTQPPISQSGPYVNNVLGFSVNPPLVVALSKCTYAYSPEGKRYVRGMDGHVTLPLLRTEIPNGVVFHPEWFMEISGEVETNNTRYFANCEKAMISGKVLANRKIYRDFPYWTVIADTASSESKIPTSLRRFCNPEAKFMGVQPTTQTGVFDVVIDVDMTKTDDSSAVLCPDLLYARYVPTTGKLYYLFNNGQYYIDDPTHEQIQNTLRFVIEKK